MLDLAHDLAWIKAWLQTTGKVGRHFGTTLPCATLYTALLSLALLITVLCGLPAAQTPSIANEPTLTPTEPALTPAVPGPLETVPFPQEKLLAPVPQQFNWLER
jgi:hypothetical protein